MAAPRQMTSQTLNALKGWGANLHAVDFVAQFDASVTGRVPAGSVVRLSPATKRYLLGLGSDVAMPLFTFEASDSPDVTYFGGDPATEKGVFAPIVPAGNAMTLVAIGAFELVSTNYVAGTYAPNDLLGSPSSGGNEGKLVKTTYPANTVCGVVSRGVVDNGYGHDALAFWPVFLPAHSH